MSSPQQIHRTNPWCKASVLIIAVLLAACTVPAPPPAEPVARGGPAWFEEVAAARGISWLHQSGHRTQFLLPEIMGGGAALFDMDNDGDLDLYLVQSGSIAGGKKDPSNRLYRNRGDGTFEDATAGSGTDIAGYGMGVASGDYDNDGDPDLLSPTPDRMFCSATTGTAASPTRLPARASPARAGAPAPLLWITTRTATSTSTCCATSTGLPLPSCSVSA